MPGLRPILLLLLLTATTAAAQEPADSLRTLPPDRWVAPDKALHVFGGYWSAGAGYAAASRLDAEPAERRAAAVATGLAAGLAKEAFDLWIQHEYFSWKDLVADAVGILALVAVTAAAEP